MHNKIFIVSTIKKINVYNYILLWYNVTIAELSWYIGICKCQKSYNKRRKLELAKIPVWISTKFMWY